MTPPQKEGLPKHQFLMDLTWFAFGGLWLWVCLCLLVVFLDYNVCICAYTTVLESYMREDMKTYMSCICILQGEGSSHRLTGLSSRYLFSENFPLHWHPSLARVTESPAVATWFDTCGFTLVEPLLVFVLLIFEYWTRPQDWLTSC